MPTEENKALVRRYQDIYNSNNLGALGEVLAPDFVPHTLQPGVQPTIESFKQLHMGTVAAYPDFHVAIEDLIAEGDKVVMRFLITGTHQGDFMGIPPTGVRIKVTGISIFASPTAGSWNIGAKRMPWAGCSRSARFPRWGRDGPDAVEPINRDAIVGIARVRRDTDGEFTGFDRTLDVWEVRK